MIKIFLYFFLSTSLSFQVFADRGNIEQTEPLPVPTQFFPGYFDTNIVPDRKIRLSLPLGSFEFGGTENFTIGVNLPLILYMINTWRPAFMLSARYRFFSNKNLSSTFSAYGGYFNFENSKDDISIYFINATYNNSITLTKKQILFTQVNALKSYYKNKDPDSAKFETKNLNTMAIALGHYYIFNQKWSLQNIFAVPILFNFNEEDQNSSGTITFKHIQNYPVFYRLLFAWRVTPNSLITFGGFLLAQSDIGVIGLPWIDWSVLF